jgi:hypothetical protein
MKMIPIPKAIRRNRSAAPILGLLLALQGCGLDKVPEPGALFGPSELGLALKLQAFPDWVVADNQSESQINATLFGPDGRPLGGRGILFRLADEDGNPASIGELRSISGEVIASGSAATAVTNSSGVATVFLAAPARTDILVYTSVLVQARPMGDDANAAVFRDVRVQIVPADPRLFPPNPTNMPPTCGFAIQPAVGPGAGGTYPSGFQILFQSTASDTDGRIVRYEWDFDDGAVDTRPDVNHAFLLQDTYTVTHTVTDNNGAQSICFATIVVKD